MASTITADTGAVSGSAGLKQSADSSGILALATGTGTTAVTIDASQNVGIGTSSPFAPLAVNKAQGAASTLIGVQNDGTAGTSTKAGLGFFDAGVVRAAIVRVRDGASSPISIETYDTTPILFGTNNTERARIDSSGNFMVGTTTPVIGKMTVSGGITSTAYPQFNIYSTNSSTAFEWVLRTGTRMDFYVNNASVLANLSSTGVWTNASDARYKENIVSSQYGLDTVMALQPRAYNLIDQADKPQIGFIAQEVLEVVPELVDLVHNSVTEEDRYTLSYGQLTAVLTKAIQEQQAIIEQLRADVEALKTA